MTATATETTTAAPTPAEAARAGVLTALAAGNPVPAARDLANMYDRSERWARGVIAAARQEHAARPAPTPEPVEPEPEPPVPEPELPAADPEPETTEPADPEPRWQVRVSVAALALVSVAAMLISSVHIYDVTHAHGQAGMSFVYPAIVDIAAFASGAALTVYRQRRRRVPLPVWVVLVASIGGSLAANVLSAEPDLVSRVIAAWAPATAFGLLEVLIAVLKVGRKPAAN